LLSLKDRRFLFHVFLNKILNWYINIDISSYIEFFSDSERYSLRVRDEPTLKKNYTRTNTFKLSFFNRIDDMWNALPLSVRLDSSISSFKKSVRDFLSSRIK